MLINCIYIFLSYLLGSISGSLLVGKVFGIDIRTLGSKNAGGTNAFRSAGLKLALPTVIIDILKGIIPEYIFLCDPYLFVWCSFAAILGHVYPIFYGFKGGKGAGTLIGVIIASHPIFLVYLLPVWIISMIFTGYVGLSTILAGFTLPVLVLCFDCVVANSMEGYFYILISLFILFTHRENVLRMISGTESRFHKMMLFRNKKKPLK